MLTQQNKKYHKSWGGNDLYTLYTQWWSSSLEYPSFTQSCLCDIIYIYILSNYKVPVHKLIESILFFLFFLFGNLCVYVSLSGTVYHPPFNMIVLKKKLDFSFQKRQTICFNLKSVSPGCIFQRLYQSHPFHIFIQVPVYEEIIILYKKNQLTQYNQKQKSEFSTTSENHLVTTSHIWSSHINISVVHIPNRQSIRIHFINAQCLWRYMKKTWWMHRKYQPNKWKRLFNWWTKRSNFSDKTV